MPASQRSLVSRLVLAFLVPSLVILALLATLAYILSATTLRDSVFARLDAIATVKEASFDQWIQSHLESVSVLAGLRQSVDETAVLIDEDLPPARHQEAHARLLEVLTQTLQNRESFREILVLAPIGGRVLVSTEPAHEGQFRIYDRYYEQGRKAAFVQNVYPSPITLQPTLTISAPLRSREGELVGVLAAHLSLEYLDEILQRAGLGRSGVFTLVDRHAVLVTGQRYGQPTTRAGDTRAIAEVIEGRDGFGLYRNLDGQEVIGIYRWLADRELGLIVEISQSEALAPARRLAITILAAGLSLLALLVGGILLVARRIARPILAITHAAALVREGDLEARADVDTRDEIGDLAASFNQMVEQLASDSANRRQAAREREALITELEAKNAELERFTYTVSHDLKSPLLTIRGFLGALRKDLASGNEERLERDFARISDAARKMGQLLDELLDLSRIGRVVNPPRPIPFAELAREVAVDLKPEDLAPSATIEIAEDLPVVYGDRVRLGEVLENLISNALKFMGEQSAPKVEIGARRDGDQTLFFVADNGCGIEPQYHDKIFGLFDRLDPSIEGTGIGLAIVRRIIEVHGGRIWVESEGKGHGTTFLFSLPDEPASEDGVASATPS